MSVSTKRSLPGSLAKSQVDAGWGLIYRLNTLYNKIEDAVLEGNFDRWNFILDRIYINMLYKDQMEIVYTKDDAGNIIGVDKIELSQGERIVHEKFKQIIKTLKTDMYAATLMRNKRPALARRIIELKKDEYYKALCMKDAWLRKVMMEKGLYLKEFEFDQSRAMWGG